jgi:fibronectin type 3 domain-containing protein
MMIFYYLLCFDCIPFAPQGGKGQSEHVFIVSGQILKTQAGLLSITLTVVLLLSQSALAGSLLISWDPIPSTTLAGYKIKFGTTSGSYSQSVSVGKVTSHTLQSLTDGVRYYFVVVGVDANSVEGMPSAEVSGLVLNSTSIAASSITTSSAIVTWTTNKPGNSQVEYGTTTSYGSMTPLDSTLVTNHSQTLTNLNPGTTYNYRIRSVDLGG